MDRKIERIKRLDDKQLFDVTKNYKRYGYSEEIREAAILTLNERGYNTEYLTMLGVLNNNEYERIDELYKSYIKNSKIALANYLLTFVFLFAAIGFGYSSLSETTASIFSIFSAISVCLFFIFIIVSFKNQMEFDKVIRKTNSSESLMVFFLIGMPFYILTFFYMKNKMKEQMQMME